MLFLSLVDDGNAIHEHGEGDGRLGETHVASIGWEPRIIVVLNKYPIQTGVIGLALHRVNAIDQVRDAARGRLKGLENPEVDRVVHQAANIGLIRRDNGWVAVEYFAHNVHSSSVFKGRQEVVIQLVGTVEANTVDAVVGSDLFNPVVPHIVDITVLGTQIGKGHNIVALPTILDRGDAVVVNQAEVMKVALRIERVEDAVINTVSTAIVGEVVGHNIQHKIHASVVEGG